MARKKSIARKIADRHDGTLALVLSDEGTWRWHNDLDYRAIVERGAVALANDVAGRVELWSECPHHGKQLVLEAWWGMNPEDLQHQPATGA
jgi:hypothetical protein